MFDELRATPEVLYGAAIAFVIVVLLTPAVGGMARLLGAVDQPDARRLNVTDNSRLVSRSLRSGSPGVPDFGESCGALFARCGGQG
jgi:hypothetical protein